MGCDIHMYVEYKKRNSQNWIPFGGRINPGRNYYIFGLLSKGVRCDIEEGVEARGLPIDISYQAEGDAYLIIDDEEDDNGTGNYCSLAKANSWASRGNKIIEYNGKPYKVEHPDWHSHSWLTTDEFSRQINIFNAHPEKPEPQDRYEALLSAMLRLQELGNDVRVVFWFDN